VKASSLAAAAGLGWVTAYRADLPGWLAGVGVARNKGTVQATYQASYENALVALLGLLDTRVAGADIDAAGQRTTQTVTVSEGALASVLILETWFDDRTGSVWTLTAARERTEEGERDEVDERDDREYEATGG